MTHKCIDVFCHCLPHAYCRAVNQLANPSVMFERAQRMPVMVDLDARLRVMDQFPGYQQIVSLAGPPIEVLAPENSIHLARVANDSMGELAVASETRICGFVASLPLDQPAAACDEATRAVRDAGAVGIQIYTSVAGRPLDDARFEPVFQAAADLGVPVLLHPSRSMNVPDYPFEQLSRFDLWWAIGWPYETTLAMVRLALAGIFDRLPSLKIIAHHVGGFLPMLEGRLGPGMELLGTRNPPGTEQYVEPTLEGSLLDACKRFYVDTASFGSRAAIECGQKFFGTERLLFASDMPFDPEQGPGYIRATLSAIDEMDLIDEQRRDILAENARRLFGLNA